MAYYRVVLGIDTDENIHDVTELMEECLDRAEMINTIKVIETKED